MILVCGATGTIGGLVIREFAAAQLPVTALLRKTPTEKSPLPAGVGYAIGDLANKTSLLAALEGAEKVFLLSANGEHQDVQEENLIEAAVQSGVSHIVKLSVMGAGADSAFAFGRLHGGIEEKLKSSGIGWTLIRPNMMMQNLRWYQGAMKQGVLPFPLKDAPVSHVDAKDVAAVVFQALTADGHSGKAYTITGPEALAGAAVAAIISEATNRQIQYQSMPMPDFRAFMEKSGEPAKVVDAEVDLFEVWSQGGGSEVTKTVEEVTKRKPAKMVDFAKEHAAELV